MEISIFDIYLIFQASGVISFIKIITLFMVVAWIVQCVASERIQKIWILGIAVTLGSIATVIPKTETLIAMYSIPQIVNSKEAQKLPVNLIRYLNHLLEDNKESP